MMNAAMMIAPAPQAGTIQPGGKAAPGQGKLFGQAMAQQEQQVVYQSAEQDQSDLSGLPGRGALLNNFFELFGTDASDLFGLQPEQQDLLEQLDMELFEGLALLLEQGVVPNSMDPAQLQQLVGLVEEILPQWQFHKEMVPVVQDSQQELLPEQQDPALEQKVEELIAWLSQYQEQAQNPPGKEIGAELPPGQLVAAQKLEQIRERLSQLRATMAEDGNNSDAAKAEGEAKGNQMATAVSRGADLSARQELPDSPLEARFSELLKPRRQQAGQSQVTENGRQAQPAPPNQTPTEESAEELMAKVVDKSSPQGPLAQVAVNAKQAAAGVVQQHNHMHGQPAPTATAVQTITAPAAVTAPFAASQQVADSQIFDQVVTHLSGSVNGESGRMILRLHPAELGALKIELMIEGDRVRANLHAQTQQVQEVLERNLGQLRHALAEQGLKIDHFQVTSDARQHQHQHQHQGQAEDLAQQRHQAEKNRSAGLNKRDATPEDQEIPLAHLTQNGGRGINLHV